MKRNNFGSAVVDYIVPTAVVGLVVGLGVYGLFQSGNLTRFFAASGNMQINDGAAVINPNTNSNNPLIKDGSSSTNLDKPMLKKPGLEVLDGNEIDYGDFVLTGIPEDFSDYIEAAGNAGGTDVLAELIRQIAMKSDVDVETKNLLLQLANNGHSIARTESEIERIAKLGLEEIQNSNETALLWDNRDILTSLSNGQEITGFNSTLDLVTASMGGSSDPQIKSIYNSVKVLADEINDIAAEVSNLSGPTIDSTGGEAARALEILLDPNGSERTDINSALICTSGNGEDSGFQCN